MMHTGSCLCGAITFHVAGELPPPEICHCRMCRKQSGHCFASTDVAKSALSVADGGTLGWYASSGKIRRGFCTRCGSSLFWEPAHCDWIAVAMGAFDGPTGTAAKMHIFTAEKGDYYPIDDNVAERR